MSPEDRNRATRRALAALTADSRLVHAARRQQATAELLDEVFAELDDAGVTTAPVVPGLSRRGVEVLSIYGSYQSELADLVTRRELFRVAANAVSTGQAPVTHVVLMDYGEHNAAAQELLSALDDQQRLTVLSPSPASAATSNDQPARVSRLLVAPDAEEEVRLAIRTVLNHLEASRCRPERIGIAYVSATPYARILAEQLTVAQVPHHIPGQQRLAQTTAGRAVSGLLALHERDFPRRDTLRWMADGPLLDAAGEYLPVARWERQSRDAGIDRGLKTWASRLDAYAHEQRTKAADKPEHGDQYEARATSTEALLAEVQELDALATAVLTASTWPEVSQQLVAMLRRTLGSRRAVDSWSARTSMESPTQLSLEQQAYDSVVALLQSLARNDGTPVSTAITGALAEGLDTPVPSGTTLGRGVLVGSFRSFVGADLDLLLVLGCSEDALPLRQRESTVLRDADRALLSPELATVASRRAKERDRWQSALAAAETVHLSYSRADVRAQRRQFPSPWFLEQATRLHGSPVSAAQVDEASLNAPWFASYASFESSMRAASIFTSVHELDVAMTLQGGVDELALFDARLHRGLEAARARAAETFDKWSGSVGELPDTVRNDVDQHLSASSLQTWATCPASHFFGATLGVRDLEDRARGDTIDARDKGTLLHEVLEEFLRPHLRTNTSPGIAPDTAWATDDIAKAVALLEKDAAALTARGLTGREVLWEAQLARLRRSLARVLAVDSVLRRDRRSTPVAVEAAFGRQGVEDLVVALPTQGEVPFAGYIDRIDVTETGGLVVVDYKTGKGWGYDAIPKAGGTQKPGDDLLDRGRKLQLLLYGLAARQLRGLPSAEVQAWFWFVELGDLHRGGMVSEADEERLASVLDVVVGGIRGGVNPANPGVAKWSASGDTWENCQYCHFDRVCPTTRAEQWAGVKEHPLVRPYSDLVEPPPVAP